MTTTISSSYTAANSVLTPFDPQFPPNGGEGPISGTEVMLSVSFPTPISLPSGHFFFAPQVDVLSPFGGQFLWLSAAKPISGLGTTPFSPDIESWMRSDGLGSSGTWSRIGTDLIGGT